MKTTIPFLNRKRPSPHRPKATIPSLEGSKFGKGCSLNISGVGSNETTILSGGGNKK